MRENSEAESPGGETRLFEQLGALREEGLDQTPHGMELADPFTKQLQRDECSDPDCDGRPEPRRLETMDHPVPPVSAVNRHPRSANRKYEEAKSAQRAIQD